MIKRAGLGVQRLRDGTVSTAKESLKEMLLGQGSRGALADRSVNTMARHWPDLALASSLAKSGRFAEAIAPAERALSLNPQSAAAMHLRNHLVEALNSGEPVLVALELSANLNPDDPDTHLTLGVAYSARNRMADAERAFKKALDLGYILEGHTELAVLYCEQARYHDAMRHAEAALATTQDVGGLCSSMANEVLARIAHARGDEIAHADYLRRAFAEENMFRIAPLKVPFELVVLASQNASNVPLNHLLPVEQFGRTLWYMEYAGLEQIDQLPKDAIIFNAIGEPDNARAALDIVSVISPRLRGKILNSPEKVMATRRDRLGTTLGNIDHLWTPVTLRCPSDSLTPEFLRKMFRDADQVEFLVRPVGSHVGAGLLRVRGPDDILRHDFSATDDVYVSRFWDGRDPDGLCRSYRVICIDRQVYPYHLAIGSDWMVHRHRTEMESRPDLVVEEMTFLETPEAALGPKAFGALCQAAQRLDMDFVGIDFGLSKTGEIVVFEANATMLVRPEAEFGIFAGKARHIARIVDAFQVHLSRQADRWKASGQE